MKALLVTMAALVALAPGATWAAEAPAPAEVVTVSLASGDLTLYPFTTKAFPAGTVDDDDPVNLIFEGAADPRDIRAALLSVDGDRTAYGLPAGFPFNCTWTDGEGEEQATWTAGAGWEGSAIQLTCGPYAMRFHVRFFRHGNRTLGGAHMDLQVPGTTNHDPLGWDLPAQLVTIDLLRSGLLAGSSMSDVFGPSPYHRALVWYLHNGLPMALRDLLHLTHDDIPVGASDPIPSSGRAAVLTVLPSFVPASSDTRREIVVNFNQTIPKPFCNDGTQAVRVVGPVHFTVRVQVNPSGRYLRTVLISGLLAVTPMLPTGPGTTVQAVVFENHRGMLTDNLEEVQWSLGRTIYGAITQSLSTEFSAGQHDGYSSTEDCGAPAP